MKKKSGYEKCAHLYDLFDTKKNIEFFLHFAQGMGEVLDIGAGTGRIAIPIATHGVNVTCIEPSPAMRMEFLKKIERSESLSKRIRLCEGDARSFTLDRKFSLALLSGTFDHFLDDDERISSLKNINSHLKKNGILVFEIFLGIMKDSALKPAGRVKKGTVEYKRYVGTRCRDNMTMETHLVFEIYDNEKLIERIEECSLTGIITRAHLHSLLTSTGFTVQREYGTYTFTPYQKSDSLLMIAAEKVRER
jgi:SAM-dependent methyltransferase